MKKIILSLMSIFLLPIFLVGCGESKNIEEISEVGYKSNIGDSIEYEVIGLESTTKLEGVAPVGNSLFLEPNDKSNVLLDFIIDVTNNGKQDFDPYIDLKGKFIIDDSEYSITAEAEVGGQVANFNNIKPKTTAYVHIYTEIKEELITNDIELQLQYGSETKSMKLNKNHLKPRVNILNYGEKVSNDKDIEISIEKGYTTKQLDAPKKGDYFSHYYKVEDNNSTYAILELNITNKMSNNLRMDDTISVSVLVDGKYQYSGYLVGLSNDQTNFDTYPEIEPNKSNLIYSLIEVPDNLLDKQITFKLNAFREPYYIDLK